MSSRSDMDPIETCAARWILQRDRAHLTLEQRAALERWLAEDGRHREAYLRLDELWRLSASLKSFRPADGRVDLSVLEALESPVGGASTGKMARFQGRFHAAGMRLAAVIMIGAVAISWVLWPSGERYATAVGGYERILLEDGSAIQLNTDTRLRVRYTPERRTIQLERGEAYFEVAHNSARPFVVEADGRRIVAVGTQFSVRKDADDVRVSVTDGTVRLETQGELATTSANYRSAEQLVPAGSIAVASAQGTVRVARATVSEVEQQLSWRSGLLMFKNRPLAEIVAEFNRYNIRQLRITDPRVAAMSIDGNFKPNDLESFLAALRTLNVETAESGDHIEVYRP